jgi:hypothetical protein
MTWQAYRVVLRLHSPLHIGQMKLGNVQRTRSYVTGRVLWGALTERLTRDLEQGKGPATDSQLYRDMGGRVHDQLAFIYLFPTPHADGTVDLWPWDDGFRPRFLSTYASTALVYPQQSADEGTLHEVECIAPHTLDTGSPVYLAGYVFEREGAPDWQSALHRLQLGGERGYGWGRAEPVDDPQPWDKQPLFSRYTVEFNTWPPVLKAKEKTPLLAHALAADFDDNGRLRRAVDKVSGPVEPLVGRETHPHDGRFGVWLSPARICYTPGSIVPAGTRVQIGSYGIWEAVSDATP